MRALIADDHEIVRVGIQKLLVETLAPDEIAEASNGIELFTTLEQAAFDILILDVSMPEFDPLAHIRSIREAHPEMPILVVSAHDDDAYVQGLLAAGVRGYHLKDQPFKDLAIAIERVLAGEMWLSSPLIRKMSRPRDQVIQLSSRQIDIVLALSNGLSNKEIADKLTLSIKTIENHLTRLYRQLNVNSRLEAVKYIHDHPHILRQNGHSGAKAPEYYPQVAASGHSVVVVDDNRRFRKQVISIIGGSFPNLNLYEAENSQALQSILQHVHPTLIFLDVVLKDEDGIGLTHKIKQQYPEVKVILITAYPDREFHRLGLHSGALALIDKKDLDKSALKQIIDDIIG